MPASERHRLAFAGALLISQLKCAGSLPEPGTATIARLHGDVSFVVDDDSGPWVVLGSDGATRCTAPCIADVSAGESGWVVHADERLAFRIPADGGRDRDVIVHVRPPRGSVVAPWIMVPVGAAAIAAGIVMALQKDYSGNDFGTGDDAPSGSTQVTHPNLTPTVMLSIFGAGMITGAIYLWASTHTGHWIDVETPNG